jgi:hypothetical protein
MRYLTTILITLLLAVPAMSVELFRYRYYREDGREFECVFETDEQTVPKTVGEEKAAEIAADWVTIFYQIQVGALSVDSLKREGVGILLKDTQSRKDTKNQTPIHQGAGCSFLVNY